MCHDLCSNVVSRYTCSEYIIPLKGLNMLDGLAVFYVKSMCRSESVDQDESYLLERSAMKHISECSITIILVASNR